MFLGKVTILSRCGDEAETGQRYEIDRRGDREIAMTGPYREDIPSYTTASGMPCDNP